MLVVMGVAGCGKSTVAETLSERLGWEFAEGDALHPVANVAKMARGEPLTDVDRRPWLAMIASWIDARVRAKCHGIITCSALKRSYRDVLRGDHPDAIRFIHLDGPREVIASRLATRQGHYMPVALLDSQFADLEPPGPDEHALIVDVTLAVDRQAELIVRELGLCEKSPVEQGDTTR